MTKNAIIVALFGAGLAMSGAGAHAQPAPQVASIATPAITSMPEDQIGFLSVVIGFQPKADKEVREESRVDSFWRDRVVAICKAIPTQSVVDWRGTISALDTDPDGKVSIQVALWNNVWLGTWRTAAADSSGDSAGGTRAEQASPVAGDVSQLKVGDMVSFSGSFVPRNAEDCAFEKSLTQSDSLDAPEFVFKFRSIKPEPSLERAPASQRPARAEHDGPALAARRLRDEADLALRKEDPDEYLKRLKERDPALWLVEVQFIRPDQYAAVRDEDQKRKAVELAQKQKDEPEKFLVVEATSSRTVGQHLRVNLFVESALPFAVKDVAVLCQGFASNGSSLSSHEEKLAETIPANGRISVRQIELGQVPTGIAAVHCIAVRAKSLD